MSDTRSEADKAPADARNGGQTDAGPAVTPAARRALQEAEERRQAAEQNSAAEEFLGRGGLDPARYGDWEVKGLASDF